MKTIVLVDFPDKWPSLLPQLSQNLMSQVQYKQPFAMRVLFLPYDVYHLWHTSKRELEHKQKRVLSNTVL